MTWLHLEFIGRKSVSDSLDSLQALSDGRLAFEQQLRRSGVYFLNLDDTERNAFQARFDELDHPPHEFTDRRLRLLAPEGGTSALFDTLAQLFLEMPEILDILLRRGMVLDVENEQVEVIREALTGQATVTILDREYRLYGRVSHRETGEPFPDVAMDARLPRSLLRTSTDAEGNYELRIPSEVFEEEGERIDVGFRLHRNNEQINREPIVLAGLRQEDQRFDIAFIPVRAEAETYSISGMILEFDSDLPLPGISIDARFQSPSNHNITTATTVATPNGAYRLPFSAAILDATGEGERIDVVFVVRDGDERLEYPPGHLPRLNGLTASNQVYDIRVVRPRLFTLSGLVTDAATDQPVPALPMDFYFTNARAGRLLRTSTTSDLDGGYRTTFSSTIFAALDEDQRVDVSFQWFAGGERSSTQILLRGLRPESTQADIRIETGGMPLTPVERPNVHGRVASRDGRPLGGLQVAAFAKGIGWEDWQDTTETDGEGLYRIAAEVHDGCSALVLRVLDSNNETLASAEPIFELLPDHVVDFVVDGETITELAEYERHQQAVAMCLRDRHLGDLDDDDLVILAGTSGVALDHLQLMRLDARWCRDTRFPISSFYALLRQDLPRNLRRLMESKRAAWRSALTTSLDQGIVESTLRERLDELLDNFEGLATTMAFEPNDKAATPPLGAIVRSALDVDEQLQTAFVRHDLRHEGNERDEEFWTSLQRTPEFAGSPQSVEALRFTAESSALLGGNLRVLSLVQERRLQMGWRSVRELAAIKRHEWRAIADESGSAAGTEDGEAYAETVAHSIEQMFPTAVVEHQLAADDRVGNADLRAFFASNTDFDIIGTPVSEYLSNGADLRAVEDLIGLDQRLRTFQRLSRTVERRDFAANVKRLIASGFGSATEIAGDRKHFMSVMAPVLGADTASGIYEGARSRIEEAQIVAPWMRDYYIDSFSPILPHIETLDNTPDWIRLFGRPSGCACEHCSSVLSPAAYMTDLLEFLRNAPVESDLNSLEAFLTRRPDVAHILLDCKNTNTTLPYIDLVNELLENAVGRLREDGTLAPDDGPEVPPANAPEDRLVSYRAAVARFQTTWEEARLRAEPEHENLKVYADVLAEALYPWTAQVNPALERAWHSLEYLGIRLPELWEVSEQPLAYRVMAYFKITLPQWHVMTEELSSELTSGDRVEHVAACWGISPAPPDADSLVRQLSRVSVFLERSGLSYSELEVLIQARFLHVLEFDPGSPRPVRRQRIAIAPLPDADPCDIENLRVEGLDYNVLQSLHRLLRLRLAMGWTVQRLTQFLDTFDLFWDRSNVVQAAATLARTLIRLAAALRMSLDAALTLYRIAPEQRRDVWARTFGMAGEDYDRLIALLMQNPHTSPTYALDILEKRRVLDEFSLDPAELLYALQGRDEAPPRYTPAPSEVERFLFGLHAHIKASVEDGLTVAEPEIDRAVADRRGTGATGEEIDTLRLGLLADRRRDLTDAAIRAAASESIARFVQLDPEVVQALLWPLRNDSGAIVHNAVLQAQGDPSSPAITDFADFLSQEVANPEDDAFATASAMMSRMDKVARIIRSLGMTAGQLRNVYARRVENGFLDLNDLPVTVAPPSAGLRARTIAFFELASAVRFRATLSSGGADLFELMGQAPENLSGTDFLAVLERVLGWSTTELATAATLYRHPDRFKNWRSYRAIFEALRFARRSGVPLRAIVDWSLSSWVREADSIVRYSDEIRAAARAKHVTDEAWWRTIAPFEDALREKKRDALLEYLIYSARDGEAEPLFADAADIYASLLIDPEMSSCALTSRIKQANAAIQLFVQRCLLGLERDSRPDPDEPDPERPFWDRWYWMKNYRVWEANRKVFLFPENWLEPDLRDDQTPFFRESLNSLLQNELTPATIEQTFVAYLQELEEVSRLDIRALYEDEATGILHVFGRTRHLPHRYFYRNRRSNMTWTPWEAIDANIEGDHLIPVVDDGRLILFWAIFSEADPYWTVEIRWSEYESGRWGRNRHAPPHPKLRLEFGETKSETETIHRASTDLFTFKTSTDSEGRIIIGLYFAASIEVKSAGYRSHFNDRHFRGSSIAISIASFTFDPYSQDMNLSMSGAKGDFKYSVTVAPSYPEVTAWSADQYEFHCMGFRSTDANLGRLEIYGSIDYDRHSFIDDSDAEPGEVTFSSIYGLQIRELREIRKVTHISNRTIIAFQLRRPHVVVVCHQDEHFTGERPFVLDTGELTFLVSGPFEQSFEWAALGLSGILELRKWDLFIHPFASYFKRVILADSIDRLLSAPDSDHRLDRQQWKEPVADYGPGSTCLVPEFKDIDFSLDGSYACYNWEIFFHLPFVIANRLSESGHFEEADRWFRYIFDPTSFSQHGAPEKYWRVKPFFEKSAEPPETLMELLRRIARSEEREQVKVWRDDPFNPHTIARLRTVAYMKSVVMKYFDNLIAWGDNLFQLDTIETINEAAQLYLRASELLGHAGVEVPEIEEDPLTYALVAQGDGGHAIGPLSNIWLDLEDWLPADLGATRRRRTSSAAPPVLHPYFCIPANPKLQEYRDTVADRLFKIRNCMNIEGQARELPLFEPPIDPALLVRARAAGLDLRTVLSDVTGVRQSHFRYAYLHQKALDFAGEVRAFEIAWQAALEKKDAETLARMQSDNESELLSSLRTIKQQQVREARETLDALHETRRLAMQRKSYYESRPFMNAEEIAQQILTIQSTAAQTAASALELAAASAHASPDYYAGGIVGGMSSGAIALTKAGGGSSAGAALRSMSGGMRIFSDWLQMSGSLAGTMAGYRRRQDDWRFQTSQAETELDQIDKQILAGEIRLAIAENDLANNERQIAQSREVDDFLREKFTNAELYSWMARQLSALHHKAFGLAFDLAKRAERAARVELGVAPERFSFVKLQAEPAKGRDLLAGARLAQQMREMEAAYLERNRRELEITKHISLAMLDPAELVRLRETGSCRICIPEVLFDLDFPGHYRRRIKAVNLTLPCVAGPYTSISATLRLSSSRWRRGPDEELTTEFGGAEAIAVSTAQNDSGLFELSFRDERFLPFEGAGAVSDWALELPPKKVAPFDYNSITDVTIRMAYTSRDGGAAYRNKITDAIETSIDTWLKSDDGRPLTILFSLRHDFPSAWRRLLHPTADAPINATTLEVGEQHFFFFLRPALRRHRLRIVPEVLLKPNEGLAPGALTGVAVRFGLSDALSRAEHTVEREEWGGLPWARFSNVTSTPLATWQLSLASAEGSPNEVIFENVNDRWIIRRHVLDDVLIAFAVGSVTGPPA